MNFTINSIITIILVAFIIVFYSSLVKHINTIRKMMDSMGVQIYNKIKGGNKNDRSGKED